MFMLRRSLFILVTYFLFDQPTLQIMAHQYLTMAYLCYIGRPLVFETKSRQRLEFLTEAASLFATIIL